MKELTTSTTHSTRSDLENAMSYLSRQISDPDSSADYVSACGNALVGAALALASLENALPSNLVVTLYEQSYKPTAKHFDAYV